MSNASYSLALLKIFYFSLKRSEHEQTIAHHSQKYSQKMEAIAVYKN
ncbi:MULTISPECIES: hypothetical protein [Fischerella]|nr:MULTISPECIES: hypothetical protein [Fischerella]MBD2431788.1 hypothetical protein [Fischerella sp. FACHB-380]